jgi:MFS family permease
MLPSPTPPIAPVGTVIQTDVPSRLDRLAWSPWHRRVVIALGITWVLDGLEAQLVGGLTPLLRHAETLNLTATQTGAAHSIYLAGQVIGALLFGRWTDKYGRKKLFLITLGLYLLATGFSGTALGFGMFAMFRFLAGAGIGGEYAAINSAIDELIPARVRGQADLVINGSYWLGVGVAGVFSDIVLNLLPISYGWRLVFGLGAILGLVVVFVRRNMPESPRWLLLHGRVAEANTVMDSIEDAARKAPGAVPSEPAPAVNVTVLGSTGFRHIARVLIYKHRRRSILGLVLMVCQAFFYNAIFFTYSLILTTYYDVKETNVGSYIVPFAIGNLAGPILLGRLFDTIGRRRMISGTYALSGITLVLTGILFLNGMLTAKTQTLAWCIVFFFASPAASSAYLTVSELFPVELRGMAISLFYAIATGAGVLAPMIFAWLIGSGERSALFNGYVFAAVLMIIAAGVAWFLAEDAEQKSLEQLAEPGAHS